MRKAVWVLFAALLMPAQLHAKVVVFWQPGFPTIASQPIDRAVLEKAFEGMDATFANEAALSVPETLANAELLILPYGSAVPTGSWKSIEHYLSAGGNLLVIGGQPLRVPVSLADQRYTAAQPQDTYSRVIGFRHTYEVPVANDATFHWKSGYSWLPAITIHAQHFFSVEGRLDGLGYMVDSTGLLVAAPVIFADHLEGGPGQGMAGSRIVALDFDPAPGYWKSTDGISLIQQSADYARQGQPASQLRLFFHASARGTSRDHRALEAAAAAAIWQRNACGNSN